MKFLKKWIPIIILFVIVIIFGLNMCGISELYIKSTNPLWFKHHQTEPKNKIKTKEPNTAEENSKTELNQEKKDIILIASWIYDNNTRVDNLSAIIYADFIYRKTAHPYLIVAIISKESNFRPCARSSIGALGLGQIRPEMWLDELEYLGLTEAKDLYNWRLNVMCMDHIINKLLKKFNNDIDKVLKYYVGGNHTKYINSVKNIIKDLVIQKKG